MVSVMLVAVLAVLASVAYLYSKWRHNYWAARAVQTPPYLPFLGHFTKVFNLNPGRFPFDDEVYYKYGGKRYSGLYELHNPVLFVGDLDLLRHILVKDFDHFVDRRMITFPTKRDKIMEEMLSLKQGSEWKALRSIMSPTFTSGKIKSMFRLVCEKADALISYTLKQAADLPHVEIKENFSRFTMDTIASTAFGIECNSFDNEKAEFAENAEQFFNYGPMKIIKLLLIIMCPKVMQALNWSFNGTEVDFFKAVVEKAVEMRKKGSKRGDYLDLLLEAQNGESEKTKALTDRSLVSQSILFLIGGFDTTASTLGFTSYELARNPEEQQRLRKELQEMLKEGDRELSYQSIMEAKYLDSCINETLRMYPPLATGERTCTKQYQLPGTDLHLRPGTIVQFPIWSIHHDPKYWPEPYQYRPDRFMPENKANITQYSHMPFGVGPRNCIAMRFAQMEVKVALAKMVLAFEFTLVPGQVPLEMVTGGGVLRSKKGIKLYLKPLTPECG